MARWREIPRSPFVVGARDARAVLVRSGARERAVAVRGTRRRIRHHTLAVVLAVARAAFITPPIDGHEVAAVRAFTRLPAVARRRRAAHVVVQSAEAPVGPPSVVRRAVGARGEVGRVVGACLGNGQPALSRSNVRGRQQRDISFTFRRIVRKDDDVNQKDDRHEAGRNKERATHKNAN